MYHNLETTILTFGKYLGTPLKDCDDSYINWVAQDCPIKSGTIWEHKRFGSEDLRNYARTLAVHKGLGVMHNGSYYSKESYERMMNRKREKESQVSGHHYTDKSRVRLTLRCVSLVGYEGNFGFVNVYKFVDADNRTFTYRGTSTLDVDTTGIQYADGRMDIRGIGKGDTVTLTATIKHGEYRDVPETYIQRIKDVEMVEEPVLV